MTNIIDEINAEQIKSDIPEFAPGDTVSVNVRVVEGNRERLQAFEGVVIAKRNRGLDSAFTVRKISHGEGVERVFQTHSPQIESINVRRKGDVRRAKLYYLRERAGKSARIREKLTARGARHLRVDQQSRGAAPQGGEQDEPAESSGQQQAE